VVEVVAGTVVVVGAALVGTGVGAGGGGGVHEATAIDATSAAQRSFHRTRLDLDPTLGTCRPSAVVGRRGSSHPAADPALR
jgi:hypothetical protein